MPLPLGSSACADVDKANPPAARTARVNRMRFMVMALTVTHDPDGYEPENHCCPVN